MSKMHQKGNHPCRSNVELDIAHGSVMAHLLLLIYPDTHPNNLLHLKQMHLTLPEIWQCPWILFGLDWTIQMYIKNRENLLSFFWPDISHDLELLTGQMHMSSDISIRMFSMFRVAAYSCACYYFHLISNILFVSLLFDFMHSFVPIFL